MSASDKVLGGLGCPSCGGSIAVREGVTTATCPYCGTGAFIAGDRGIGRWMVLDEVDRAKAGLLLRRWLGKGIAKAPNLARESTLEEAFLAFFPFARLRFDVVGWVLGIEKRRKKRGDHWVTEEIPREVLVERPLDHTLAAADLSEFGVGRVDLAGDELVELDEDELRGRGMVFHPSRSILEAGDRIAERAMAKVEKESSLDRVSFRWTAALRRRMTLVYYPLWVFRYSYRGSVYQALIDAEDGSLAYGKAPGNHFYRAGCVVAASAGAAFMGTTILQHAGVLLRSDGGLAALGVLFLMLAGLVGWGFHQFRHGGVVEDGTGRIEPEADEFDWQSFLGVIE